MYPRKKHKVSQLQFLQWNCRSLGTNITYLNHHLDSKHYDVLILQSLNVTSSNAPHLSGFYYPPVIGVRETDDIIQAAIYIREDLKYNILLNPSFDTTADIHACAVTIKFNDSTIIHVMSVYLPKGPNEQNTEWLRSISKSDKQKGKWLIGGDFNAHSPFWEKDSNIITSNRLVENIVDSDLILLNDGSITRIPDNSKHRATAIDLSFISPELSPLCSWETYGDSLGSDHLPIMISLTLTNKSNQTPDRTEDIIPKYNYKKADWNKFQTVIASHDLQNTLNENDDINKVYSTFKELVIRAADLSIPKIKETKSSKHHGNVWWNDDCEKAVKNKKDKYKLYIKNKSEENHNEMKAAKNYCNKVINNAKKEYWQSFCTKEVSTCNDSKKIWKKIQDMKNNVRLPSFPIETGDNQFPSDTEKAEIFADFFSTNSRIEGLSPSCRTFREKEEAILLDAETNSEKNIYINAPITMAEVQSAISALKNKNCSVGLDAISNEMIKHLPQNGVIFLHELFKKCWEFGILPHLWKESVIVPIHKSGKSRKDKNNYRPIALTSHICKLFESIILQRLLHYCEKNNIIPPNQAGFRKGRSTTEHLIKLSTQIKHQFARRRSVLATFFDVRKAYDQVWHYRLLQKLTSIGLSGNIYEFIKSFLSNRTVQTRVGKTYSSPRKLDMGIPQGSIIAPILFNIMMNDLPKAVSKNVTIVQYADDICMWMNVTLKKSTPLRSQNHIRRLYQADLNSLGNYMLQNGLSLSTEKTNLVLFNAGDNPNKLPDLKLYGKTLEYKKSVKFLGIILTSKLAWSLYFDYLLTKARKNLNLLKTIAKLPWGMDTETLIHLSMALIRSKLTYGQEIYFSAPKYLLKKLQSLDCKAYKVALGVPSHTSNKEVYKIMGILPLDEYRELTASKYVLKSSTCTNNIQEELRIRSDIDFPKRARSIYSQMTIATYTHNLIEKSGVKKDKSIRPSFMPIPPWELRKPSFDISYTDIKKKMKIQTSSCQLSNLISLKSIKTIFKFLQMGQFSAMTALVQHLSSLH